MQEYLNQLPTDNASPGDAIEAIVEKFPRWLRRSLFREPEFVALFRERIMNIVARLPEDTDSRKPLQIELAYIAHTVYAKYGIVLARDEYDHNTRMIEYALEKENLLMPYRQFSEGKIDSVDVSDPSHMGQYLEYLHTYAFRSLDHLFTYIDTCVRLSQLPSGPLIVQNHLDFIYSYIEDQDVDAMLIKNKYLGGQDMESSIELLQLEEKAETGEDISYDDARAMVVSDQRRCARFHIYLNHLARNAIAPRIDAYPLEKRKPLFRRLNDFRDILDPEMFVPASFNPFNVLERMERLAWEEDGRTVH